MRALDASLQVGTALERLLTTVPPRLWLALFVLLLGIAAGYAVGIVIRRVLEHLGVPSVIEGTSFERTARDFGTSTVTLVSRIVTYFIVGIAVLAALSVAQVSFGDPFWSVAAALFPQLFLAVVVVIVGVVVGDKVELLVAERLRGIKLPQASVLPLVAKYSVIYLAVLIALSQVGVATLALIVLLGAYLGALIVLSAVAFRELLQSGAAGTYLLLHQPYSIGDNIRVGSHRGIVQEMDLFVTHIEADGEEYIVPNSKVFQQGVVRIRE